MITTKKYTALFLLFIMIFSIIACSDTGSPENETTTAGDDTSIDNVEITAETTISDDLPAVKYDGAEFNILIRSEFLYEFASEGIDGDVINDAVYKRNLDIEERFNVQINIVDVTGTFSTRSTYISALTSSVLAGDGAYDMFASAANYILPLIPEGYFLNLGDLGYIDFSKPWWPDGYVNNMTVDGKTYLATGTVSINMIENMCVLFFNKKLMDDYKIDYPYTLVNDNNWTLEEFEKMIVQVCVDLNNDGVYNREDTLGFMTYGNMITASTISMGLQFSERDNEGYPSLTYMNDRTVSMFDAMISFMEHDTVWIHEGAGDTLARTTDMQNIFSNGNILFMAQVLSSAQALRGMDIDFGIIPMPKYDTAQSRYYTCVLENLTVTGIPVTAKNNEMSAVILEAMAADGYKNVIPKYYETALKTKFSRDNDSEIMLDLIRDNIWFDFLYLNSVTVSDINHLFSNSLTDGKAIVTEFEAKREQFETKLATLIEGYKNLEG